MNQTLSGQIERITYTSEDTGFTVAKLKVSGEHDLITAVGYIMSPIAGEIVELRGCWVNHPQHGRQFKAETCKTSVPASVVGIRKYLGSGLIKGIGPVMAQRIVKKFGKDTLDIIEKDTDRLYEIQGIGKKRVDMIRDSWACQKQIREVMVFLQSHGVSSGYAAKIFKQYGDKAVETVTENPYKLAEDIWGIGFITADNIAQKIGFKKDSPKRIKAGVLYVLNRAADDGHVYLPYDILIKRSSEILGVENEPLLDAIAEAALEEKLVIEDLNELIEEFMPNNKAVYLSTFHFCEKSTAYNIKKILSQYSFVRRIDPEKAIEWVQARLSIVLAQNQVLAVKCAAEKKMMIITGGPGTGKTTIIKAIIEIFERLGAKILLAAPTGRAAKRMNEACGRETLTIHRLLEFSFKDRGFKKNSQNPLQCDLLVLDEVSMIDTVLMHHLLKALPYSASLIMVGDTNQLPSVGSGNVLKDIIESEIVPVVELNQIFRQAKASMIVVNAHKINKGQMPFLKTKGKSDFYFIEKEDPQEIADLTAKLASEHIPSRFGFDPVEDIQVLTPMRKGIAGVDNLNLLLQRKLNKDSQVSLNRGQSRFMLNDKVMQIKNNYDKGVFNGDIGKVLNIDFESQKIEISFYGGKTLFDFSELNEITLAYAVTVHKAQGAEYPAVIFPVISQHYVMLQRNLIYTAITRGKKLVVVIGTPKALAIGIKNDMAKKRFTGLKKRLIESFS